MPVLLLKMSASTGFTRPCCLKTEIIGDQRSELAARMAHHLKQRRNHLLTECLICLSKLLSWFLLVLGNEGLATGVDGFLTSGATLLELPLNFQAFTPCLQTTVATLKEWACNKCTIYIIIYICIYSDLQSTFSMEQYRTLPNNISDHQRCRPCHSQQQIHAWAEQQWTWYTLVDAACGFSGSRKERAEFHVQFNERVTPPWRSLYIAEFSNWPNCWKKTNS